MLSSSGRSPPQLEPDRGVDRGPERGLGRGLSFGMHTNRGATSRFALDGRQAPVDKTIWIGQVPLPQTVFDLDLDLFGLFLTRYLSSKPL